MVAKNKRLLNSIRYRNADGSYNYQPADTASLSTNPATGVITASIPAGVTVYETPGNLPISNVDTGKIAFVESNNRMYIWSGTGWYSITTVNRAPRITVEPNAAYSFAIDGTPIIISLDAEDSDQTPIIWSFTTSGLGNIASISQDSSQFTITPSTSEVDAGSFTMTFIASDGVNSDTAQSIFTLQFTSEYWSDVVLNIGTGTVSGRNNSTYIDRSIYAATVSQNTATSPIQTAFHPYLDNWSVYFDGSDLVAFAPSPEFNIGNGDFTFETWINTTVSTGTIFDFGGNTFVTYNGWRVGISSGAVSIIINQQSSSASGEYSLTGITTVNNGKWNHIRITRTGTSFRIFVNGILDQSGTSSVTGYQAATGFYIGGSLVSNTPSAAFTGHLSNFRLIKGTSLNSTNDSFTPPAENLTNVSGTSLLLFTSNRFVDLSTTSHTYVFTGDPKVVSYNPFGQSEAYAPGQNLGSSYHKPSTTSYVTSPYTTNYYDWWTEDYTIEAWVYPTSLTGWSYVDGSFEPPTLIGNVSQTTTANYWSFGPVSNGTVKLHYFNGAGQTIVSSETVKVNQWNHIALVKNSSGVKIFVNGIGTSYIAINGTPQSSSGVSLGIGRVNNTNIQGYVSDVKISKGFAAYTTDFTLPTSALTNTNATFYLPMDDAGIFDTTGNNTLEIVGNAQTSSAQTKFATTSILFDGSGDYILSGPNELYDKDFTIELWWYPTSTARQALMHGSWGNDWSIGIDYSSVSTNQKIGIWASSNGSSWNLINSDNGGNGIGSETINQNQWNHIAYTRSGTTWRLFVNGVLDVELTGISGSIARPTQQVSIGAWWSAGSMSQVNGYLENFQILNGVAKYTTNFTPPTAPQNIQNQLTS